jgi:hypothetical protein
MNIVVFPLPYKQKMPSTGPLAVVFLHRSLIYYFLQEIKREVPNYFGSSAKEITVQTSNAQCSTRNARESAGGGLSAHLP